MDDVGASSKLYEVYARTLPLPGRAAHLGDVLILKYLPPFRAWGPYRELTAAEWRQILEILAWGGAVLTVAVTAAWVDRDATLVPFPDRFPDQAEVIREGVRAGRLEVADHGLTHCVLQDRAFRPRLFSGNRRDHREFWPWLPAQVHRDHLQRAQSILEGWLGTPVVTFVPPGNVFSDETVAAAAAAGLRVLSCGTPARRHGQLAIIGNDDVVAFHDRDLVMAGTSYLTHLIEGHRGRTFCFVRDLAGTRE